MTAHGRFSSTEPQTDLKQLIAQGPAWMPKCPDCGAVKTGMQLQVEHAPGCPIGRQEDLTSDRDRDWFDAHPGADFYYRPPSWSEEQLMLSMWRAGLIELLQDDDPEGLEKLLACNSVGGRVRVERVPDIGRIRTFRGLYLVLDRVAPTQMLAGAGAPTASEGVE